MAKFEDISKILLKRVQDGTYIPSQKLPSEYDLAAEFNVSRLTIRKAIDHLIRQQILIKSPGKGTYVITPSAKVESGRMGLQGFTEVAKTYGKTSHTEVLRFRPLKKVSDDVAQALALSDRLHQNVDELVRRRFWDDDPMTIEHVIICHEYVAGLHKADFTGSLFEQIEKNVPIAYSHQKIEAVLMDHKMASLLDGHPGDPLLRVHAVTYTVDAKPILVDTSYYRADKYAFKSTLTRYKA